MRTSRRGVGTIPRRIERWRYALNRGWAMDARLERCAAVAAQIPVFRVRAAD